MADFEHLTAIRGPKLADSNRHVIDVLALNLVPEDEFEVGKLLLAQYAFVPYAVSGLAAAMETPSGGGARATTTITVPLHDDTGGSDEVTKTVTLFGPGDVIGLDPRQIVRRYPAPGSTNSEETFHAHIEFDRPELPWAFSAHTPGDAMPSWLALVVVERAEVEFEPIAAGLLPVMSVDSEALPPLATNHSWTHAQTVGGSSSLTARLSSAYAPVNVSRLLAARILTQNTDYVACVVPTTEAGRNAGLGLAGGTLGPAWASGTGTVRLPVYDRWEFRTGPDGDFARLATRLVAVAAPWEVGRRIMNAAHPGSPFGELAADEPGRTQVIRCALYSPAPAPPGAPDENAGWASPRIDQLRDALEAPARIAGIGGALPGAAVDLPIVGPRIYATAHRGVATVPAGDWFAELNLSPVHRVVAGLGTRVVIKDQEPLMQAAWAQVGEIEKANRALALAELARNLGKALHARLAQIDPNRLLQLANPLAARTRLDGASLTITGQIGRSATPPSAVAGAMRRAIRPTGPIARRLTADQRVSIARIAGVDGAARDFCRPYQQLDGVGGLSAIAMETLDPVIVGQVLGVAPDQAMKTLTRQNAVVVKGATLATVTTTPALWKDADVAFQPAAALATTIGTKLSSDLAGIRDDVVVTRARGGLLAGLATSKVAEQIAGTVDTSAVTLELDRSIHEFLVAEQAPRSGPVVVHGVEERPVLDRVLRAGASRTAVPAGVAATTVIRRSGTALGDSAGLAATTFGVGASGMNAGTVRAGPLNAGAVNIGAVDVGAVSTGAMIDTLAVAGPTIISGPASTIAAGRVVGSIIRPELTAEELDLGAVARAGGGRGRGAVVVPVNGNGNVRADRERLDALRTAQGTLLSTWLDTAATLTVADIRDSVAVQLDYAGALDLAKTPALSPLDVSAGALLTRLEPNRTVVDSARGRLNLGAIAFDPFLEIIRPIMAAPRFDRPMYQALDAYDREWLVPGLSTLPEPEMVTLLAANDQFMESFLVGLSDEMGRELLWRQYPTDQRGTYFHRFWDADNDELSQPIHRFSRTPLGRHVAMGPPGQSGRAVIVIRGEIVRRYPDLTVMALRDQDPAGGNPVLPEAPGPNEAARTMFVAMLPPDIMLCGLDITVDQLLSGGWWVVLAEHPQATRFRRQESDLSAHEVRFTAAGGAHGAAVAAARLENPVRIAFEAGDFLPPG